MPSVLKNFLIGVGLDTEDYDRGAKRVESSLGRMRSVVGITGAAIAGAFAAVGTAAIGAGQRVDRLALEFEKFRTSPQYIYDYGNAIRALGGSADEAAAAINVAESSLASFRQTGQLPGLDDLAMAGVDVNALTQADTGQDFLRELARQMPGLSKEQQLRVQETLGLSDAVMRSLRGGVDELDRAVARAHDLAGNLESAVGAARDFNEQLAEFGTRMEGIGNTLAEKILPGFTDVLQSMGGFIDTHKEQINAALGVAADNPGATALMAGGGAAATGGVLVRGLIPGGIGAAGARIARLGGWGAVAGAGLIAGDMAINGMTDEQRARLAEDGPLVPFGPQGEPFFPLGNPNATPVYSGGEVSNAEAAAISPGVVMIRDQREQAQRSAAPQRVDVQNHIDMKLEIEGRALDSRITEVVERRERNTADDLLSSVDR
ncbi:hypothetical protein ABRY95_13790 [Castellaniella ginsengisoli]|uniref:Tail tape measure protein n=1 Tax=Castellaniella ginsengisoli TaxID=546114 RepID=A0AB39GQ42_9BURK